jgi:hypothetical protein
VYFYSQLAVIKDKNVIGSVGDGGFLFL